MTMLGSQKTRDPYECTTQTGDDIPGDTTAPFYVTVNNDANCDGIDGDIARALFVDGVAGDDVNVGSMEAPLKTIQAAMVELAADPSGGKDHIYVSKGNYNETLVLVDGVSVFGGYSAPHQWASSPQYVTNVRGVSSFGSGDQYTVSGVGIDGVTRARVQNLRIETPDASGVTTAGQGRSNYAIHCVDCSSLELVGNIVHVGQAGKGRQGANEGAKGGNTNGPGANGTNGRRGSNETYSPGGRGSVEATSVAPVNPG